MKLYFDSYKHLFVLVNCVVNLIISIYVFSNGFLLRRLALNATNYEFNDNLKQFDNAIIIFIDALRFDFAITSNKSSIYGMKTIESLTKLQPTQAKLFKFISDVRFFKIHD